LDDVRLGQGRENAKQYLKDNPQVTEDILNRIRAHMQTAAVAPVPEANGEVDDDEGGVFEEA
jgi:recombination protein RecA